MQRDKMTRRKFVAGTTGAALGAMIVPRHVLGGPGYQAPSDRLNVAVVGCGGQGAADATELVAGGQNIVALADVDFAYVDAAVAQRLRDGRAGTRPNRSRGRLPPSCRRPTARPSGTPTSARCSRSRRTSTRSSSPRPTTPTRWSRRRRMELGKHVYVEKPLTWSVHEARVLRETAKRTKVVTQMGNQGHSSHEARLINEWIQAGVIGPVREVYVWTNRPIWPQGVPRPAKPARARRGRGDSRRVRAGTGPGIGAGPGAGYG